VVSKPSEARGKPETSSKLPKAEKSYGHHRAHCRQNRAIQTALGLFQSGNRLDSPDEVLNLPSAKMYGSYLIKQIYQKEHSGKSYGEIYIMDIVSIFVILFPLVASGYVFSFNA
jgi:hypothetical protein